MNNAEFTERLNELFKSLFNSGFLKNVKSSGFTHVELAQIQTQLCQIATQTALQLQELDYKKQQVAMEQEKMRQELEMAISREKIANIKNACDAVSSAIQAESIKRSVVDNASISKTNAYVSYFNTAMNAVANNAASLNEGQTLKNISDLVLLMIEKINDEPLASQFDDLLSGLIAQALNLKDIGLGNKQVSIIAPKTILEPNEPITLLGVSVFTDNESEFVYNDESVESKFFVFQTDRVGSHEVTFRVKNNANEWISDKIFIKVLPKPKNEKGAC